MKWPNVTEYLKTKTSQFGDARLMIDYETGGSYTYREFDAATDRMASGFCKMGVKRGDRIAFLHPNHTDVLLGYFAAIKADAVAVPVNPMYTAREITHILNDSTATTLISTDLFYDKIRVVKEQAPSISNIIMKKEGQSLGDAVAAMPGAHATEYPTESSADDLAMIFYTSGTTGRPKGVMISHRNITFGASNMAQNYGLTTSDVAVVCLPLNHIFANASPFWGTLASGGSAVVMERFQSDQVFDAISKYAVTWFAGVPTMFNYLISSFDDSPRNMSSLRMGLSGAASLSVEHLKVFEAKFGAGMLEVYGLTESTGLVTANPVYGVRKPGSIGLCVSGVSVRIVDAQWKDVKRGEVGELIFKGPNGTSGYWGLSGETEKKIRDGWVSTGDLGRQDEEGYFYIASRKNELIISGGYNIFPREIEEVLYRHPDVGEVAVIGVSDPDLGEVPKAFVAPKAGKALEGKALEEFCLENLTKYKVPRTFEFMEELPKNTTGKIVKNQLK